MSNQRVFWLLNHETLSNFELPLIKELGFEIFTPKIVPKNILQQSGSVTFEYDKTLSIPTEDLNILNDYNFYENEDMPIVIRNLINKYFDISIVMFDFCALNKIIDNFKGYIFARAFGLGESIRYYDLTKQVLGEDYFYKIEQIKDRFWFSHCYENIPDIEVGVYKEKSVFMPLGLPDDFYTVKDQWTGEVDKLLFFCTRINFNPAAGEIYKAFRKVFRGFDYIIAGNQPIPVDDDKVTGFLEREELNDLFKKCKVMYYQSTYPRHLHYHPLEAMIAGMPVVYMDGGALSVLGGNRQSGCSKDIKEARNKVKRILNGDKKLIEEIREDQKEILYKFSYEYNKKLWSDNFLSIVNKPLINMAQEPQKIAVFISELQPKNHLDEYIEMINMFNEGIKEVDYRNELILNVPHDHFKIENEFLDILKTGVTVREYKLETISTSETSDSLALMFKNKPLWYGEYIHPVDYAKNYIDADYWLFINDNLEKPIAPLKPYGIYVDHIANRYSKAISKISITNYKNAAFLITSSESTKQELVKHLGVKKEKIIVMPFILPESLKTEVTYCTKKYTLIDTDMNVYEDIVELLSEITDYYSLYRTEEEIKIHINNCSKENNIDMIDNLNHLIQNSSYLKKYVSLHIDLRVNEYDALFAHAKKIIFPFDIQNILFKIAKAVKYSKPIILNDLPLYKEFGNYLGYNFIYKKFNSDKNAIVEALTENVDLQIFESELPIYSVDEVSQVWRNLL